MMCVHVDVKGKPQLTGSFFCDTALGLSVSFINYRMTVVVEYFVGYEYLLIIPPLVQLCHAGWGLSGMLNWVAVQYGGMLK